MVDLSWFEVVSPFLRNQSLPHLSLTVVDLVLQVWTVSVSSGCFMGKEFDGGTEDNSYGSCGQSVLSGQV